MTELIAACGYHELTHTPRILANLLEGSLNPGKIPSVKDHLFSPVLSSRLRDRAKRLDTHQQTITFTVASLQRSPVRRTIDYNYKHQIVGAPVLNPVYLCIDECLKTPSISLALSEQKTADQL